jgi:hypothetical protein
MRQRIRLLGRYWVSNEGCDNCNKFYPGAIIKVLSDMKTCAECGKDLSFKIPEEEK